MHTAGERLNVIGACVYEPPAQPDGPLRARFIMESLRVWHARAPPQTASAKRLRVQADTIDQQGTAAAGAVTTTEPWGAAMHGNMDSAKFNAWFHNLCMWMARTYPKVRKVIQMDNAKYHRERIDPPPTNSTRKAEIASWLTRRGIEADAATETKAALMARVKVHAPAGTRFRVVELARLYDITIIFQPPYHPELQPIEMVWAAVKAPFRSDPAQTVTELRTRVVAAFQERVTEDVLRSAWQRSMKAFSSFDKTREKDLADALCSADYVSEEDEED